MQKQNLSLTKVQRDMLRAALASFENEHFNESDVADVYNALAKLDFRGNAVKAADAKFRRAVAVDAAMALQAR